MFITKRTIDRRTTLRAIGTALALPMLDCMIPALGAAPKSTIRFGAVYVPNGIMMGKWTPATDGSAFELTPTLQPLQPFREQLLVLTGLNSTPPPERANELIGNHSRAATRFLTDIQPKPTLGSDLEAGISMDQILAKHLGRETQLASLELGLDSNETSGGGDTGYSRAYTATISWRSNKTPLPMENNPRAVFERLFGDSASTDKAERIVRIQQERSILDMVTRKISRLESSLGSSDRLKLEEYLESIRDVERRIEKAEQQSDLTIPVVEHPGGIPDKYADHVKLMYDLYTLAYQCDLTRVITFMKAREFSGRTYPELGIHDAHHAISHHQGDPEKLAKLTQIDRYHVELLTYFLEKLKSTPDGDGSLLDHIILIYGAGMSDGNSHSPVNLPILLLGGGAGLKGGRHISYPKGTPLANLHLAVLDKLGVPMEKMGDSTRELEFNSI